MEWMKIFSWEIKNPEEERTLYEQNRYCMKIFRGQEKKNMDVGIQESGLLSQVLGRRNYWISLNWSILQAYQSCITLIPYTSIDEDTMIFYLTGRGEGRFSFPISLNIQSRIAVAPHPQPVLQVPDIAWQKLRYK